MLSDKYSCLLKVSILMLEILTLRALYCGSKIIYSAMSIQLCGEVIHFLGYIELLIIDNVSVNASGIFVGDGYVPQHWVYA